MKLETRMVLTRRPWLPLLRARKELVKLLAAQSSGGQVKDFADACARFEKHPEQSTIRAGPSPCRPER